MNIPDVSFPRVVVIGAGFAGLNLAKALNTKQYQLVLIDKNNFHTFQPLMYQVATAGLEPDSIAYPIRKSLKGEKNTYFRLASVTSIDKNKKVITSDIGTLPYDHLIIATGATNNFFGNKSIEDNAVPMKSLVDALDLRSKILGNFEAALNTKDLNERNALTNFVIVGAGPTGVELAGALAELKNKILPLDFPDLDLREMKINLVEAAPRVLAAMSEKSSKSAHKYLQNMGVDIWLETFVENYEGKVVKTSKREFISHNLIWAAGVQGEFPKGIEAKDIGKGRRIIVNDFLEMKGYKDIYVLGDAAIIESESYPIGLPMLGSVAMQQGAYLARQFNNLAKNKKKTKFTYSDKGTMATIGKNKAVVEIDKFKFHGILAWLVWMFVHLMLLVGFRNRAIVFLNWTWNYFRSNNGLRLIIRPYRKRN
ncbi:MAG: NADH dehydrogenase [Glaciecola sp.]|jgi:NADH dehydrogenase